MAGGIPQEHPPCWRQTPRFAWAEYTGIFFDVVSGVFFFNTDRMVVSDSSMPNSTLLFSSKSRNVQRLYPSGGSLQLNAMSFASASPVTFSDAGGVSLFFRFITNLKKFCKKQGMSQMALANLCETSGNYIGEIEMGRRIPSFEKIEKIALALKINAYQLLVEERPDKYEKKEQTAKDFLENLPFNIKKEIISHVLITIHNSIDKSFDPKNY
jgi:transcriptional regulator with XRE-family HTH domain